MRIELAAFTEMQDSAMPQVVDSTSASTAQAAEPEFRTPQNAGFMQAAYTVAAVILGGYLLLLRRRWTSLKKRQNNAAQSRR